MTITIETSHTMCHAALCTHCMCRDDSLHWLPLCRPPILKWFDRDLGNNKITTLDASSFSGLSSLQYLFVWPRCRMHDTHALCVSIVYVQTHDTSSRMCVTIVACCTGGMCMCGDSMRWSTHDGACTVQRKQLCSIGTMFGNSNVFGRGAWPRAVRCVGVQTSCPNTGCMRTHFDL